MLLGVLHITLTSNLWLMARAECSRALITEAYESENLVYFPTSAMEQCSSSLSDLWRQHMVCKKLLLWSNNCNNASLRVENCCCAALYCFSTCGLKSLCFAMLSNCKVHIPSGGAPNATSLPSFDTSLFLSSANKPNLIFSCDPRSDSAATQRTVRIHALFYSQHSQDKPQGLLQQEMRSLQITDLPQH